MSTVKALRSWLLRRFYAAGVLMGGSNSKQAFRAAILDLVNNQQVSRQKPRTTILSEILLANYVRGWKVNFNFDFGCPATYYENSLDTQISDTKNFIYRSNFVIIMHIFSVDVLFVLQDFSLVPDICREKRNVWSQWTPFHGTEEFKNVT